MKLANPSLDKKDTVVGKKRNYQTQFAQEFSEELAHGQEINNDKKQEATNSCCKAENKDK